MCVVSNIGDYTNREWERKWPNTYPTLPNPFDGVDLTKFDPNQRETVSKKEFDELKAEVVRIKELLEAGAKYDRENGEPHCEMSDKVTIIKKVADFVGVDLGDIFEEEKKTSKIIIGPPITSEERGFFIKGEFLDSHGDTYYTIIDRWFPGDTIEEITENLLDIVGFLDCAINDPDELENHENYYEYIRYGYIPNDTGGEFMQLLNYQIVWSDENGQEFEVLISE